MKRLRLLFILLLMFLLTGCIQKYEYTDEQSDASAEYMAGLLLKYDKDYEQDLVPMKDIIAVNSADEEKAADAVSPTATPQVASDNQNTTDNTQTAGSEPAKEYTLNEVMGVDGFDLQYTGYLVADTYPEDPSNTYFSVTPYEGNQLIVVSFMLTNRSDKEQTLDLSKAGMVYQLDINAGTVYESSFSVMENDLRLFNMKLAAGEAKPVILIFEVKKDVDMTDINLMVTNDNKSEIIEIK